MTKHVTRKVLEYLFASAILIRCGGEGEPPAPIPTPGPSEKDYTLTVQVDNTTEDKLSTGTGYFVEDGTTDTVEYVVDTNGFTHTIENVKEGSTIIGTVGVKETPGYEAIKNNVSVKGNTTTHLTQPHKTHEWDGGVEVKSMDNPVVGLEVSVADYVDTTDVNGLADFTFRPNTDDYNEPFIGTRKAVKQRNIAQTNPQVVSKTDTLEYTFDGQRVTLHMDKPTNPLEEFAIAITNSTRKARVNVYDKDFRLIGSAHTDSEGNLPHTTYLMQLNSLSLIKLVFEAVNAENDTLEYTIEENETIFISDHINPLHYDIDISITPSAANGAITEGGNVLQEKSTSNGILDFLLKLRQYELQANVDLSATGHDPKTIETTFTPGQSNLSVTLQPSTNELETITYQVNSSTPNATHKLVTKDFESIASYVTNGSGNLTQKTLQRQLDNPEDIYVIISREFSDNDTLDYTIQDGSSILVENQQSNMHYDVDVINVADLAHGIFKEGSVTLQEKDENQSELNYFIKKRQMSIDGIISITADGYNPKTITDTFLPGNTVKDGTMTPIGNDLESFTFAVNNSTKNASVRLTDSDFANIATYTTNSSGAVGVQTLERQLDVPETMYVIISAQNAENDTLEFIVSDGSAIAVNNNINLFHYDVAVLDAENNAQGIFKDGTTTIDTKNESATSIVFDTYDVRKQSFAGSVALTADGFENKTINQTFNPGSTTLDGTMVPIGNELETFYVSASNASNNMNIIVKNGSEVLGTYATNTSGNLAAQTITVDIPAGGLPLSFELSAANADSEVLTYTVQDEQTRSINTILNHHFNISTNSPDNITGENALIDINEGSSDLVNGAVGNTYNFKKRAKSVNSSWSATANGAVNKTGSKNLLPGNNNIAVDYDWNYSGAIDGERTATAIGSIGTPVFTFNLDNNGDGNYSFVHTNKNNTLRVVQVRNDHTSSTQDFAISKGVNNLTLADLLGKYTVHINNVVTGSSGELFEGNTSLDIDNESGGRVTHYFEDARESVNLNELVTKTGYLDWSGSAVATPGLTELTANQVASGNEYTIEGKVWGPILANTVGSGNIHFNIGGDDYVATIQSNGDFAVTINGPYDDNTSVSIDMDGNSSYSSNTFSILEQGVNAAVGKIASSTEASGFVAQDAIATLGELDNKTSGDDVYITWMSNAALTNNVKESLQEYTSGVESYNRNTVRFFNKTTDYPTNDPIGSDQYNGHINAINFFADKFTAPNGQQYVTLLSSQEGTDFPASEANAVIYQTNSTGAGGTRVTDGTNLFKALSAHTMTNDNWNKVILEIAEGFGINDNSSGSNSFGFVGDGSNNIINYSPDGKVMWNTSWTYEPGTFK